MTFVSIAYKPMKKDFVRLLLSNCDSLSLFSQFNSYALKKEKRKKEKDLIYVQGSL